jgi:hypothetical protein
MFIPLAVLLVAPLQASRERLPNLVELPPATLEVRQVAGRSILRFTSTAANLGAGALTIVSRRPTAKAPFSSVQEIRGAGESSRAVRLPVQIEYRRSGGHEHFHLLAFERYELRSSDGRILLRDHKAGYCLGDRMKLVTKAGAARWTGSCGRGRPGALALTQGISPGYADPYDETLDGQSLDITGLASGVYVLVNVVNPARTLRESSFDDNAASVRFVLAKPPAPAGIAFVRVLATCRSDKCSG